jgi:hypothetical protein
LILTHFVASILQTDHLTLLVSYSTVLELLVIEKVSFIRRIWLIWLFSWGRSVTKMSVDYWNDIDLVIISLVLVVLWLITKL